MSTMSTLDSVAALAELRRHKGMFDNTWTLTTLLAAALSVLCGYFGLVQVNVGPIIWTLALLALGQLVIASQGYRATSAAQLRRLALVSQFAGATLMGVSWHFFGGLQQPLFPLFIVLPLLPAALVLGFWQQQAAMLGLLAVLVSGVLLAPDTNSFIAARYGISIAPWYALPDWMPRSAMAFPDVNTSPDYELVMVISVGVIGFALSNTARALVDPCRQSADQLMAQQREVDVLKESNRQLIARAPYGAALVSVGTGRILNASERLQQAFDIRDATGRFLLDTIDFAYPAVIRRLMKTGGEEVQGATVRGQEVVLRVRAQLLGAGTSEVAALSIESCDEICWRGAVDAFAEPVFAINSRGCVAFLNRAALQLLGDDAQGVAASTLFTTGEARWWDIAPLDCARRILDWRGHRYLASLRRERVAASIGELSIVRLQETVAAPATA
jgi:PAS domain-containing protein